MEKLFARIVFKHQNNDANFQLHTEIRDITAQQDLAALRIADQFNAYAAAYGRVDEALKKINKSAYTAELQDADRVRDDTYIGMTDIARAGLRHFDPAVRKAAERLKILFDTYGNVTRKPLYEQTAAVYNILQELTGNYADDAEIVGIDAWVAALDTQNKAFDRLVKDRFDEKASKTDIVLKTARAELDAAFKAIRDRIEAYALIEGREAFDDYVKRVNVVINKYAALMAAAAGRRKKAGAGGSGVDSTGSESGDADAGTPETDI